MYCAKCGVENSDDALFCKECGVNLKNETEQLEQKQELRISVGNRLFSVFELNNDSIELWQYKNSIKQNPTNTYEFKKSNIMGIKYKWGFYPSLRSRIHKWILIVCIILTIIFIPMIVFTAIYGLLMFIAGDMIKYFEISLKTGEKIKVYYRKKVDAEFITHELLG